MPIPSELETSITLRQFPAPRVWLLAPIFYLAALAAATYPAVANLRSALPNGLADPLMHLWVMKWYKACLVEGRSPLVCPDIQYPVGAPLAHFSPMHLQALLYLPLSSICSNDALCYNLIWIGGFLFTAIGVFALAWYVLRDAACAWCAGLLAMLSGPMMMHAHAHLEIIYAGGFPLFMLAWMRWIDAPSVGRLAAALGGLLLMTMGAAYYVVLAMPPAALYLIWWFFRDAKRDWSELTRRLKWLAGFIVVASPFLITLFASQFWAMAHGLSMRRERSQFDYYSASLWSYFVPSMYHRIGRALPYDVYSAAGQGGAKIGESMSYLGVVTCVLLLVAAVRRAPGRKVRFLWVLLALVVLLSMGSSCQVGSIKVRLPGSWLWDYAPVFRLTRNPARFNLFAAAAASVLAAAGLRSLIRDKPPITRGLAVACVTAVAIFDLSVPTFTGARIPEMPPCYAELARRKPRPALLEVPMTLSGAPWNLTSLCAYWQTMHHGRTSGGYSGHNNDTFDDEIFADSPFSFLRLANPGYLATSDRIDIGLARATRFEEYTWLYLKNQSFDYLVLHQWAGSMPEVSVRVDRVKDQLRSALVWDDGKTAIFDPALLPLPQNPVVVRGGGWLPRGHWRGQEASPIGLSAQLVAYNPSEDDELELSLVAEAFRTARVVRVVSENTELARWTVLPGRFSALESPTFRLRGGINRLSIRCDGEERPRSSRETIAEGDNRPYSLRIAGVSISRRRDDSIAVEPTRPARGAAR
jgi:hypothetical protein